MTEEVICLKDSGQHSEHDKFQSWRQQNPEGSFLNMKTRHRAMIHRAQCPHFEEPSREKTVDWNLTAKEKVCAQSAETLMKWAAGPGIEVTRCKDCSPRD